MEGRGLTKGLRVVTGGHVLGWEDRKPCRELDSVMAPRFHHSRSGHLARHRCCPRQMLG